MQHFFKFFPILFVALLFLGCLNFSNDKVASNSSEFGEENIKYAELARRIAALEKEDNATRPNYFGSTLSKLVFKNLPSFPGDFYKVRLLVNLGKFTNMSNFTENYWKQPEYYPQFEEQGIPLMQEPPAGRFGAFGYGSYPSEIVILTSPGSNVTTTFYMHTSWLVESYQGIGFTSSFPQGGSLVMSAFLDENKSVTQHSLSSAQYFEVTITPNFTLLEPAFPIFSYNWTQRIDTTIKVKSNTPPGRYLVAVDVIAPPSDKSTEWLYKYKTRYVAAGGTSIGVPWYSAFIEVR